MSGIPLETAAHRIADALADVLGPNTPWLPTAQWVQRVLQDPARCSECSRPLYAARSVELGRGPRCAAKLGESGGTSPARDPIKYETPTNQRGGIDVPLGVGPMLDDPTIPLVITEGNKKALCGAEHGLCIVSLPGVWNWIGTNTKGGKVALEQLRDIAWNNRRVILGFDSDVVRKPSVRKALGGLAAYLTGKGAKVEYLHLPHSDDAKAGIDDYLAEHTVQELWTLVRPDAPPVTKDASDTSAASHASPPKEGVPKVMQGDELLQTVRDWLAAYICTMRESDLDLLTLWAVHTHLVVECYTTPWLQIDSPVPESGKTTVIEHLKRLCLRSVQAATLSSPSLLTRMLNAEQRTILIDEADRSLNQDKEGIADLLAVINSGYKRGATRPVLVPGERGQWEVAEMPTFAAVAMVGNNPNLPDDTRSRIIRVLLLPDLDGSVRDSDWEDIEPDAIELHDHIAAWADHVREQVKSNKPVMPDVIKGRFREKWAPLKRVAEAAGGRWADAVDAMALHDRQEHDMNKEDGLITDKPAVVLLKHIHEVWNAQDASFLASAHLIDLLVLKHPNIWGPESSYGKRLTPARLGRMLAQGYKIHSKQIERGGHRGYVLADFTRAWRQMGITTSPSETPPSETDASDARDTSDARTSLLSYEGYAESGEDLNGQLTARANGIPTCKHNGCNVALHAPDSAELGLCFLHQDIAPGTDASPY
jgi:Protein of unknown function (DUF3631)/Domain of unknown function (DUF3854)/Family of unknown function (DUF6011)